MVLVSFVIFLACVQLLIASGSHVAAAGTLASAKVAFVTFLGAGLGPVLITAVVSGCCALGYFWLLKRADGRGWWWIVLAGGVALFGLL